MNLKFNKKNYKSNLVEFSEENEIYNYLFFKNIFNFFCFKKMRYITVNQIFNMMNFRPESLIIYVNENFIIKYILIGYNRWRFGEDML